MQMIIRNVIGKWEINTVGEKDSYSIFIVVKLKSKVT